jgi:hypothetical protein
MARFLCKKCAGENILVAASERTAALPNYFSAAVQHGHAFVGPRGARMQVTTVARSAARHGGFGQADRQVYVRQMNRMRVCPKQDYNFLFTRKWVD